MPEPAASAAGGSATAITYVGGPTALLEWAGLRILTDPTLDPPQTYSAPGTTTLVKTAGPGLGRDELGAIDLVLLSHHGHKDNLDFSGIELIADGVTTVSTPEAAAELAGGPVRGYTDWQEHHEGHVTVTVVPAVHRPPTFGTTPVCGFVLEAPGEPSVYVSGDNRSLDVVTEIATRFPAIEIAILHAGAATVPSIDGPLTLGSAEAAEAARILGARTVVGVHTEDWEHFTQTRADLEAAFAALPGVLVETPKGVRVRL